MKNLTRKMILLKILEKKPFTSNFSANKFYSQFAKDKEITATFSSPYS